MRMDKRSIRNPKSTLKPATWIHDRLDSAGKSVLYAWNINNPILPARETRIPVSARALASLGDLMEKKQISIVAMNGEKRMIQGNEGRGSKREFTISTYSIHRCQWSLSS